MTRSGSGYSIPRDANRVPFLLAASTADGDSPVSVEADPSTHALLVSVSSGGGLPTALVNNQQTVTGSAVALPSGTLTTGVVLEALSTNAVSVFVGGSGVTTGTGIELPAGAAVSIPVSNTNKIYVICASGSPVVTWIGS